MTSVDSSLKERLHAVKDSVRKATEQALKDAGSESPMELHFKDAPTANTDITGENEDPNTSSASFALGMTLFGQDISSTEREIREKLNKVEDELKDLLVAVRSPHGEAMDDNLPDDPQSLQSEAEMLRKRIQFLRECSSARSLLDEATIMSSSAAANDPDFCQSARLLERAQASLQKAYGVVRAKGERCQEQTPELVGAYRILDAIRDPMRRKRVELLSKSTAVLESCIDITPESITVRGGRLGLSNSKQAQGLHAAYDILEALSPVDN